MTTICACKDAVEGHGDEGPEGQEVDRTPGGLTDELLDVEAEGDDNHGVETHDPERNPERIPRGGPGHQELAPAEIDVIVEAKANHVQPSGQDRCQTQGFVGTSSVTSPSPIAQGPW